MLITREVLTALSFLNRMGIIHRDIKGPSSLLLGSLWSDRLTCL